MLLMLPPSEGKATPSARRAPLDLSALSFAATLTPLRERLIAAVDPAIAQAPAAPAAEVYTGVLYARLDHASLPAGAKRRANRSVLIASGLWGLLAPADRVPGYKLPIDASVDGFGTLAAAWRPLIAAALAERDHSRELIVDCRSGGYSAVWRPSAAARVEVRAFKLKPDGGRQVISHMAKATRGQVARELLLAPRAPRRPADVLALVRAAGLDAELGAPEGRGSGAAWTLDLLER
ncbi:peroxide stress protein YaaA [Conexibacter stalactiti]|uniref:Peroxide stress protein YaaA n=1 Tax=Conexibacter stalactiti TaxID=1940611 RepID=A0ABU4HNE2_9ACTN|nr:peroxide stress protein YaaA [Conexibacter stalactiti]MDW5594765.1 peroxide stress protein YaaA [Conexibacter stalactiti]MEC5035407.1 peroxide stress protein YaaA [Conexibacter stalactiti]